MSKLQQFHANIDDYRWLTGRESSRRLAELANTDFSSPAVVSGLRRELSPQRTHLVVQQLELRRRGKEKFADSGRMFFTPQGLEQATGEAVAAYKARRFAGYARVADLCCGIGGDLLALAATGPTTGVDRDPVVALLAEANCCELGRAGLEVRTVDTAEVEVADFAAWHIDPDRRPAGRRTTHPTACQPSAEVIGRLLARRQNAAIKLAPATTWPAVWPQDVELEWISHRRECRQLVGWLGELTVDSRLHRATILKDPGAVSATLVGKPDTKCPTSPRIGRYIFEPDPAVLAAGLSGALAQKHQLAKIAPGVAYLTGDQPADEALLSCFEVIEVLPFDLRRLKSLLRDHRIGRVEVKKRGGDLDPAEIARKLRGTGDETATLLLANIGSRVTAILARRIDHSRAVRA